MDTCRFIRFEYVSGLPGSLKLVSDMDSTKGLVPEVLNSSFFRSHPVMYLIFNKMFYSVFTELQYISSLATCFGVLQNHLQAVFNYREVHPLDVPPYS